MSGEETQPAAPGPAAAPSPTRPYIVVTLRERTKQHDLVADLPPHFDQYAFVDRRYQQYAKAGETWLCHYYVHGYRYLIPMQRIDLAGLLSLEATARDSLIETLERADAPLAREWLAHLRADRADQEAQESVVNAQVEALAGRLQMAEVERDELRRYMTEMASPREGIREPGTARHGPPGVLESPLFLHAAYRARFNGDLSHLLLRPDPKGAPCQNGILRVAGLETAYAKFSGEVPVEWSERFGGYLVDFSSAREASVRSDATAP